MSWFKYPLLILLFFIIVLFQISFLPHFSIMGVAPNIIFILFFILFFIEEKNEYKMGLFSVIVAGFFLDIFSHPVGRLFFGISIISLLVIYLLTKTIIYFFKEIPNKYLIFYFISLFSVSFVLYQVVWYLFSIFFRFEFNVGWNILVNMDYNLIFACIGFYVYRKFNHRFQKDKQLTLFD